MGKRADIYEDDDGRTVCPMDVEGMPWYDKRQKKEQRAQAKQELNEKIQRGDALDKKQTRRYIWYSILGGLAAIGFIGGGLVLFIFIGWLIWKLKGA